MKGESADVNGICVVFSTCQKYVQNTSNEFVGIRFQQIRSLSSHTSNYPAIDRHKVIANDDCAIILGSFLMVLLGVSREMCTR